MRCTSICILKGFCSGKRLHSLQLLGTSSALCRISSCVLCMSEKRVFSELCKTPLLLWSIKTQAMVTQNVQSWPAGSCQARSVHNSGLGTTGGCTAAGARPAVGAHCQRAPARAAALPCGCAELPAGQRARVRQVRLLSCVVSAQAVHPPAQLPASECCRGPWRPAMPCPAKVLFVTYASRKRYDLP